jgi:superfamily II DNA helicase RecQ
LWRARRLDALVVPAGHVPPLGRRRTPLLLAFDAPGDLEAWRELVSMLAPAAAVLLAGPEAAPEVAGYAAAGVCRRRTLVDRFGEPVAVPCGRCDACVLRQPPTRA